MDQTKLSIIKNLKKIQSYKEAMDALNASILKTTLRIKDKYPELTKYIDEMPVSIPNEQDPEMSLTNLEAYYDSLNEVLNKYILETSQAKK